MLAFDFYIENRQKIQMMYFYSNDLYRYARISSSPCDFLRCMMELCSDLISSSLSLPIKHLDYVTYISSSLFLYYFSLNVHINQIFGRILKGNIAPQFLVLFCFLFYLPYLSSIHEKANCIAILWTGSPHSLGSCLFRGLWVTCLPHKGGASR